jgi:hypothetical protein
MAGAAIRLSLAAPRIDLIRRAAEDWERQRAWHGVFGGPAIGYVDHAARSAAAWQYRAPGDDGTRR